jgi:hypothetical protein
MNGNKGGKSRRARAEPQAASAELDVVGEDASAIVELIKPQRRVRTSKTTTASAKNSAKKTAARKAAKPESKTSRKKK